MQNIIEQISSSPLYMIIGGVLAIFLVVSIIKGVLKLVAFMALAMIAFVGYLHFTGREIPATVEDLKGDVINHVDNLKDSASDAIGTTLKSAADGFIDNLGGNGE